MDGRITHLTVLFPAPASVTRVKEQGVFMLVYHSAVPVAIWQDWATRCSSQPTNVWPPLHVFVTSTVYTGSGSFYHHPPLCYLNSTEGKTSEVCCHKSLILSHH